MTNVDVDLDRLITVPEAAQRLRVHRDTAYAMIREGRFPVPVLEVSGKKRVSLRALVEFMGSGELERRAS